LETRVGKDSKGGKEKKEDSKEEGVVVSTPKKHEEEPQVYYVEGDEGFDRALAQEYKGRRVLLKAKDSFIIHKRRKGERRKDGRRVREEKIYYFTDHQPRLKSKTEQVMELLTRTPPSGYLCIESQPSTFSFLSEPSDWDLPSKTSDYRLPLADKPPPDLEELTNNMKTQVLAQIHNSWDGYISDLIKKI
jgi:hypothetical protein